PAAVFLQQHADVRRDPRRRLFLRSQHDLPAHDRPRHHRSNLGWYVRKLGYYLPTKEMPPAFRRAALAGLLVLAAIPAAGQAAPASRSSGDPDRVVAERVLRLG